MTSAGVLGQVGAATSRNLLRLRRNRGSLIGALVVPAIFYCGLYVVFADLMDAIGIDYAQYLTPAVAVQAILFTSGGSALAVGSDVTAGILNRMRSLPISVFVPALGRLGADLVRAIISVAVIVILGVATGFRFHGNGFDALATLALLVAFTIGICLLYDAIAASVSSPEAATGILQFLSLPLIMLSTAFVPADTLPGWAGDVVAWLPLSVVIDAIRGFVDGTVDGPVLICAIGWTVALIVVGIALSSRAFRRSR